jgi:hypothetical protein
MVSRMAVCKFVLVAAAVALSGCASMQAAAPNPPASLQNAVYVVGQDGAVAKPANDDKTAPGESKAMRFYWFLGGR